MADTTFTNGVTLTDSGWFNDLNRLHYTIFANPADLATARRTLLAGMDKITNSLSGDVALSNTGLFFTGPSVAQGTSGTWYASGTVVLTDTVAARFVAKLWDGTTVIDSAVSDTAVANGAVTISLSGYLASPAANIRISVKDITSVNGAINFNLSGASKDSSLFAIRIA